MAEHVIVTHTDLDGVAAGAVYCRLRGCDPAGARVFFVEPDALPSLMKDLARWAGRGVEISVSDLGVNSGSVDEIAGHAGAMTRRGARILWFDHHVWEDGWVEKLLSAGVELHVDRSTCSAGVVAKYLGGGDELVEELVAATCAADLWRWDHPLAGKLFRIVGRYRGGRGYGWKRSLLEQMARGMLWSDQLQEVLEDYVDRELEGYNNALSHVRVLEVECCRLAFLARHRGPPNNSLLASYILSKTGADVVAITRGFRSVSLRSKRVDVRRIALELGGGGHPAAAGAPLRPGLLHRVLGFLVPAVIERWAERRIAEAVRRAGCAPPAAGGGGWRRM